jgi:hypothetical protein
VNSKFFAEDFRFIGFLGTASTLPEAMAEVRTFRDVCQNKDGLLRGVLKVRVSGQRAACLACLLFGEGR